MTDRRASPNEFEHSKPGTNARSDAEAAIEELRQRGGVFVNAVRATRMPMVLTDPNLPGNPIVFANEAFLRLSGYSMAEVLGQQPHFMNGRDTDPKDAARFAEMLRGDHDEILETVQYRKDGSPFVATVLLSAYKDEDGKVLNHFMSWLDVTRRVDAESEVAELRKTQDALRESEEKYRRSEERQRFLLDLGDAIRAEAGAGGKIETAARRLGERLGASRVLFAEYDWVRNVAAIFSGWLADGAQPFPPLLQLDDYEGEVLSDLRAGRTVRVDDVPALASEPAYAAIAEAGVQALLSVPLLVDGSLKVNLSIHQHEPRHWTDEEVLLVQEVAERLWAEVVRARSEAALRESEEKYRTLFDTIDSGYALTDNVRDEEGRVVDLFGVDFNRSYTQHSGLPPFAGRRASEVITVQPEWLRQFEEVTGTGVPARYENYIAERDRWVSTHYSLVGDPGSDRVAVVFDDITDRKRAEAALRESEERQTFLLKFSDAIRAEPDADAIALFALRALREKLQLDRCYIAEYRLDEDRGDIPYQDGNDRVPPFPDSVRLSDFPEALNIALGRTLVVANVSKAEFLSDGDKRNMHGLGMGAFVTPAARRGENHPLFTIVAVSAAPREWTTGEIALIKEVNERTWAALERARAEVALRESEEKYAALFAASPAPFLVLRPDAPHFTIADVNDAYLAATMRNREDLVGRAMFDAFPDNPDDLAANGVSTLRASLERALVSKRFELMAVQKYDIVRPDGTFEERWWKPANAPVVDVNGNVVAIIHHVADVTAEHRAAEALRASEERFRRFGEASQDILWMRDAETLQWIYLTPAFETIYGLSRDEALSGENLRNWLDLVVPEDRDRARSCVERVRAGERVTFEYRVRRPGDGALRRLRETSFPMPHDSGGVALIGGIGHDVTALFHTEERRRESEERLRLVVENARDYAIFTTDPEGRIDQWYQGAAAVFGWTAEEAVGQLADITFTPEDRGERVPAKEREAAARDGRVPNVRWHHRKDGRRIFIDGIASALRDADGTLTGFLKIGQDVTERRRADERQKTLLAELQHRVRNILAVIRSIARRSADGGDTVEGYAQHLDGRITALARTQALLTREVQAGVDLEGLLLDELVMQAAQPDQFKVTGAPVSLAPKAAEVLGLALHELATNSVKYGALSTGDGRVDVRWTLLEGEEGPQLSLIWSEFGVRIGSEPRRRGFGTELITERVPYELQGSGTMDFRETGLVATIEFPLTETGSILQTDDSVRGAG